MAKIPKAQVSETWMNDIQVKYSGNTSSRAGA
jgi:hypothetical protein